ncbi:DUF2459 domain-containing protein [Winogradskyella sp.]|uniref:DUF2459 domain-containing protein n=1 Tax=Winogradskyella sp. TaxID=1883156 RepID=UPI00261FFC8F|nr:DUF2459 domain-containing protein [Winogradskyella sp.]
MKYFKRFLRYVLYILLLPISYAFISFLLGMITVNKTQHEELMENEIYLTTNGVHLDIVLPIEQISSELREDLIFNANTEYVAFGWGDKDFYLNTPTWGDLTFSNAFNAMFLNSSTLMHITRYEQKRAKWIKVRLSKNQLRKLNENIHNTFQLDEDNSKIILKDKGYGPNDDFYRAKGSYSIFKTCNTWVNTVFKKSTLKSCLWTPFDFALLKKYQ